jgi:hypothetical protein
MLDGVSFLVVGGYLAAVIAAGKLDDLLALLKQEAGFVEWVFAIAALVAFYNNPNTKSIGRGLATAVFLGLAFTLIRKTTLPDVAADLAKGNKSLLEGLEAIKTK